MTIYLIATIIIVTAGILCGYTIHRDDRQYRLGYQDGYDAREKSENISQKWEAHMNRGGKSPAEMTDDEFWKQGTHDSPIAYQMPEGDFIYKQPDSEAE